jgi:lysozyme
MINPPMAYSGAGLAFTEGFEGCELESYWDNIGQCWTIGYGHTGPDVHPGLVWTQAQADTQAVNDAQWAVDEVNRVVNVAVTQGEFDALVDFVFNLGAGHFEGSSLLRILNTGDYASAALEFDKWDLGAGKVVAGLLRRRQGETDEFNNGGTPS